MDERNSKHLISYDDRKKQAQDFKTIIKSNVNNKKKKNQEKVANAKKASSLIEAKKLESEKEGITFEKMNKEEKYNTLKHEGFMIKNFLNSYIKQKNDKNIDIDQLEEELFGNFNNFDNENKNENFNERSVSKLVNNTNLNEKKSIEYKSPFNTNNPNNINSHSINFSATNSGSMNLTSSNDKKTLTLSNDNTKSKKASRKSNLPNLSSDNTINNETFTLDKNSSNDIDNVAYSYLRNNLKNNMKGLMKRMRSSICLNSINKDNNTTGNGSLISINNLRAIDKKESVEFSRRFSKNRHTLTGVSNNGKSNSMALGASKFIENLKNQKLNYEHRIKKRNSIDVNNLKTISYTNFDDIGSNNNFPNSSNPLISKNSNIVNKFNRRASAVVGNMSNNLKTNFLVNSINEKNNAPNIISKSNSFIMSNVNHANHSSANMSNNLNSNNSINGVDNSNISKDLLAKSGNANNSSFLSIINKKILEMSSESNVVKNLNDNGDFNIMPNKIVKKARGSSKFLPSEMTEDKKDNEEEINFNKLDSQTNIFFVGNESQSLNDNSNLHNKNSYLIESSTIKRNFSKLFTKTNISKEPVLKKDEIKNQNPPVSDINSSLNSRRRNSDNSVVPLKHQTSEREFTLDNPDQIRNNDKFLIKKNSIESNKTMSQKEKTLFNVNDSLNLMKANSNLSESLKLQIKRNSIKKSSVKYNANERVEKIEQTNVARNSNEKPENSPLISNFRSTSISRLNNMFNGRNLAKLSKVYDSLSDEEIEQSFDFLIHPESKLKEAWDFLILLVTLYTITFVPYNMAFLDLDTLQLLIIDLFCDVVYILDLIFQFFIPIQDYDEKYITSKSKIAVNYLSSWFILDFLSSVPINSILSIVLMINQDVSSATSSDLVVSKLKVSKNLTNIAKLSRMYRLMKLVRLVKLIKISKNQKVKYKEKMNILEDMNISSTLKRLLVFLFYFVLLNHVLACIWTFIASLDYPNWIVAQDLADSSNLEVYIASLYFNLVTIFTVGYGNIISKNMLERVYNIVIMIAGIMLYTFAVSSLSNIMQQKDEKTQIFNKNLNYLQESKVRYDIPQTLFSKIKRFLTYDYTVNRINKHFLLVDLPQVIRSELICRMYKEMIENFNFFQNTNTEFCAKVILTLRPMKSNKSEVIIYQDDYIEEMVFVKRGVLSVEKKYKESMIRLVELRRKEHFGEIFMLLNERCTYNVSVKTHYCEMLLMKKIDLIDICSEFQDIFEQISNKSTYNMLIIKNRFENLKMAIDRRSTVNNSLPKSKTILNQSEAISKSNSEFNDESETESIDKSYSDSNNSPAKSISKSKKNKKFSGIDEVIEENSLDDDDGIMRNSEDSSSSSGSYNSYTGKTYAKVNANFSDLNNLNDGNENKETKLNSIYSHNSFLSNLISAGNSMSDSVNPQNKNCIIENTKFNNFEVIEEGEHDEDEYDEDDEKYDNDNEKHRSKKSSPFKGFNITLHKLESNEEKTLDNDDKNKNNYLNANLEKNKCKLREKTSKSTKSMVSVQLPNQNINNLIKSSTSIKSSKSNKSKLSKKSKKSHKIKKSKFLELKTSMSDDELKKSEKLIISDNSDSNSSDDSDQSISENLSQISLDSHKNSYKDSKFNMRRNTSSASNLKEIRYCISNPLSSNNSISKNEKRKNSDISSLSKYSLKSTILKDKETNEISKNIKRKNSHCEFSPYKGNSIARKFLSSDACPSKVSRDMDKNITNINSNISKLRKKSLTIGNIEDSKKKRRSTVSPSVSLKEGSLNSDTSKHSDRKKSMGNLSISNFSKSLTNNSKHKNKSINNLNLDKSDSGSIKLEKCDSNSNSKERYSSTNISNSIEKFRTPSFVNTKPPPEGKKNSIGASYFNRFKDPNLRRSTVLIGSAINSNIKKGSENIKDHKKFYSGIFEKWKMDEQNKRLKLLYKKMKKKI